MKLLVVRAHPLGSDRSRTMQLADAFVAGFRQSHPDALVEDINLYAAAVPEIDLDLLTGWDAPKAGRTVRPPRADAAGQADASRTTRCSS